MKTGWTVKKLGDVCHITDGSHFSPRTLNTGYPYITVSDVSWGGVIDFKSCKFISTNSYKELVKSGCKPQKGDVLFSKDGTVGKVALVRSDKEFVVLSSLAILRPTEDIDSTFLFWVLQSPDFLEYAIGSKTGAALKRVILKVIKTFEIPVPPIEEQRRIVARIEKAFAKIDDAARLRAESVATTAQLLSAALHEIFDRTESRTWTMRGLGNLCDILDSKRKPITRRDRKAGPYPYYGATQVQDHVDGYIFDEPLVLLGEDGARWGADEKSAYRIEGKSWVNNHAHVLRPDREKILDAWLEYFLNMTDLSEYITGTTVKKLNQEKMRSIKVPMPPLPEQKEIVKKLDALSEKVLALQVLQSTQAADLKVFKQSILHQAFSGSL